MVTRSGARLRRDGNQLIASDDQEELVRVPLELVDLVILQGQIHVTAPAVTACLDRQIPIAYLDSEGRFRGRLEPPSLQVAALQRAQLHLVENPAACIALAQKVVEAKLHSGRTALRRWAEGQSELAEYGQAMALAGSAAMEALDLASLRGHEGAGAAAYWHGFRLVTPAEWAFAGRIAHPPGDPLNALLSYGYTLLYIRIVGALRAVGLSPYLGFYHRQVHAVRDSLGATGAAFRASCPPSNHGRLRRDGDPLMSDEPDAEQAGRAPRRVIAVHFDIADDKRRRRLTRQLLGFGQRMLWSGFECLVRPRDMPRFRLAIAKPLDPATDRVRIYELCAACRTRIDGIGAPLGRIEEDGWFI